MSEPDLQQMFHDAFKAHVQATGDDGQVMVIKYLAVAEVIGPSGEPWLSTTRTPGMAAWDQVGLATALGMIAEQHLSEGWGGRR